MALNFNRGRGEGSNNFNNNSPSSSESPPYNNKPEVTFHAKYLGGHKAYPIRKAMDVKILVFSDRLEVEKLFLTIPYSKMTNIENMDDKKISALRVVVLGLIFVPLAIVGALWKKKKLYTVIEYNDGIDNQQMIFDFDKNVEKMQPLIYHKMLQSRFQK